MQQFTCTAQIGKQELETRRKLQLQRDITAHLKYLHTVFFLFCFFQKASEYFMERTALLFKKYILKNE